MFKILIAEDDRELRQLFQHILLKNGYTVKGVSDGQEALNALEKDYYDLIISDIMMPNMNGYELVRSLRDAGDSIPVLMVTAKDAFDDMRMGFLSGTDDYMIKPVNINELVLRVGALLRRAQMINERKQRIGDTILECDSLTVSTSSENMFFLRRSSCFCIKWYPFRERFLPGNSLWMISGDMIPQVMPILWMSTSEGFGNVSAIIRILRS